MLIDVLNNLLNRIRKKKEITGEWKNGLLVKLPKKELRPLHERFRGDHIAGYFKTTVSLFIITVSRKFGLARLI